MKVTLTEDGTLEISAENSLESYALRKFAEENFTPRVAPKDGNEGNYAGWKGSAFMIYHGEKPKR
jgi:hypothetical protein